jgi:hypothetical protein
MNLARAVAIGLVGGVVVAWLAGAATRTPRMPAPPASLVPSGDRGAADLAREIARLHDRLHPDVVPQNGRNVFAFSDRTPEATQPDRSAARVASPTETRAPDLTLSGMAENPGPDGPVRTAIIAGPGQLYLATLGDTVEHYRVARLAPDAVDLVDPSTGTTLHLTLHQ